MVMLAARVEDQLVYYGQSTKSQNPLRLLYCHRPAEATMVPSKLRTLHLVASSLSKWRAR